MVQIPITLDPAFPRISLTSINGELINIPIIPIPGNSESYNSNKHKLASIQIPIIDDNVILVPSYELDMTMIVSISLSMIHSNALTSSSCLLVRFVFKRFVMVLSLFAVVPRARALGIVSYV